MVVQMNLAEAHQIWQNFKESTKSNTPSVKQVEDLEMARLFVESSKEVIAEQDTRIKALEQQIADLKADNETLREMMTEQNIMDCNILQQENTELRNQLNFLNVNYQTEVWRPVRGYKGLYEVSNQGNVRANGSEMTRQIDKDGRAFVELYGTKLTKRFVVCLVAEAFLPNPYNFNIVRQIDGNIANLRLENLRWVKE